MKAVHGKRDRRAHDAVLQNLHAAGTRSRGDHGDYLSIAPILHRADFLAGYRRGSGGLPLISTRFGGTHRTAVARGGAGEFPPASQWLNEPLRRSNDKDG